MKRKNNVDIKDKNVCNKLIKIFKGHLESATVQRIQTKVLTFVKFVQPQETDTLVTNQEGSTKVEGHMSSGLITSAA